jgi:hypothetical protein
MFTVNHHDLPSLFSGKLHALLFRPYSKGRDYYDLMFFLSRKTNFNLKLLQNAARQTNPDIKIDSIQNVVGLLRARLKILNDALTASDLTPFLLAPEEIHYITSKNLLSALEQNFEAGAFKGMDRE